MSMIRLVEQELDIISLKVPESSLKIIEGSRRI